MNLCNKTSLLFCMGYIFKCSKNAFYGLTIHPFDRISKKICGEMVLRGPPWPSILLKNCRLPSKQLRDTPLIAVLAYRTVNLLTAVFTPI